jgi:hypothetical protein
MLDKPVNYNCVIGGVILKKDIKKDMIKVISVFGIGSILVLLVPFLFNYFL